MRLDQEDEVTMITKCHECGQDVSTGAQSCPHCGAPLKASAADNWLVVLITIGSLGSLVTLFIFLSAIQSCANAVVQALP